MKIYAFNEAYARDQFGGVFYQSMCDWVNSDWIELADKKKEDCAKRDLGTYYTHYADYEHSGAGYTEYMATFLPECMADGSNFPGISDTTELSKLNDERLAALNWAQAAYMAMEQTNWLKVCTAVKGGSALTIKLITDKILVPRITPSTTAGISNDIVGVVFDYVDNLIGGTEELEKYAVGRWPDGGDVSQAYFVLDSMILQDKKMIDYCEKIAADKRDEIDALYQTLLAEAETEGESVDVTEAGYKETILSISIDPEADATITTQNSTYDEAIASLETQIAAAEAYEEKERLQALRDAQIQAKASYNAEEYAAAVSDFNAWANQYVGAGYEDISCGYTATSEVGVYMAGVTSISMPSSLEGNAQYLWNNGGCSYLYALNDSQVSQMTSDINAYTRSMETYVGNLEQYAADARTLSANSRTLYSAVISKLKAIDICFAYGDGQPSSEALLEEGQRIIDMTDAVSCIGNSDREVLSPVLQQYHTTSNISSMTERFVNGPQVLLDSFLLARNDFYDKLEDSNSEYSSYQNKYEDAVAAYNEAFTAMQNLAAGLPSYVKDQDYGVLPGEKGAHILPNENTELGQMFLTGGATTAQASDIGAELDTCYESYMTYKNAMELASNEISVYGAKLEDLQQELYSLSSDYFEEAHLGENLTPYNNRVVSGDYEGDFLSDEFTEKQLNGDATRDIACLVYLWRDFHNRGYAHENLMEIFQQMYDNKDEYSTVIKAGSNDPYNSLKIEAEQYAEHRYVNSYAAHARDTVVPSTCGTVVPLCAVNIQQASQTEPAPYEDLILPLEAEIDSARSASPIYIKSADITLHIPEAGESYETATATVDSDKFEITDVYIRAESNPEYFDCVESGYVTGGTAKPGEEVAFLIYVEPLDDHIFYEEISATINGEDAAYCYDPYDEKGEYHFTLYGTTAIGNHSHMLGTTVEQATFGTSPKAGYVATTCVGGALEGDSYPGGCGFEADWLREVIPAPQKTFTISAASYVYDGNYKKPAVTVKSSTGARLASGRDYTVSYKDNRSVGLATVTIKGMCNYKGSVSKTFTINPAKPVISKLTLGKAGSRKLTVKMSTGPSSKGASKYKVYYRVKGASSWKTVTTSNQSVTLKSLKKGKAYQVKVIATRVVSGRTYTSSASAIKTSGKIK